MDHLWAEMLVYPMAALTDVRLVALMAASRDIESVEYLVPY